MPSHFAIYGGVLEEYLISGHSRTSARRCEIHFVYCIVFVNISMVSSSFFTHPHVMHKNTMHIYTCVTYIHYTIYKNALRLCQKYGCPNNFKMIKYKTRYDYGNEINSESLSYFINEIRLKFSALPSNILLFKGLIYQGLMFDLSSFANRNAVEDRNPFVY